MSDLVFAPSHEPFSNSTTLVLPTPPDGRYCAPFHGRRVSTALIPSCPPHSGIHAHARQDQFAIFPKATGAQAGWIDAQGHEHTVTIDAPAVWVVPRGVRHFLRAPCQAPLILLFAERPFMAELDVEVLPGTVLMQLAPLELLDPQAKQTRDALSQLADRQVRANPVFVEGLGAVLVRHFIQLLYRPDTEPVHRRLGFAPPKLRQAVEWIDEHLGDSFTLEDMANEIRFSRTHYVRLFRRSLYFAPFDYVMRCRVAKAHRLMATTSETLTEIAPACGFSDQGHMTAQFRKIIGLTPTEVRQAFLRA